VPCLQTLVEWVLIWNSSVWLGLSSLTRAHFEKD
jgi:predicted small integral membrane protein